jgi:tRNA (guanine37-N1)-methyltransferase
MVFNIITIFPETIRCFLRESIVKRAAEKGLVGFSIVDIRDFSTDKHRKVDDYPFGGGTGMVLSPEPLFRALESLGERGQTVYLSPAGALLNQRKVRELARLERVTLVCGHYEGIDQRVVDRFVDEQISIGDYVLTGGEVAAAVLVDAVTREIDETLGNKESKFEESFDSTGLLEYEQYTRPASYRGIEVPAVLLSGNHGEIERWRLKRRLVNTLKTRPDLFERISLTKEMRDMLEEIRNDAAKETSHESAAGN